MSSTNSNSRKTVPFERMSIELLIGIAIATKNYTNIVLSNCIYEWKKKRFWKNRRQRTFFFVWEFNVVIVAVASE